MKFVITGSSGFIGGAASRIAKNLSHTVRPYDHHLGQDILDEHTLRATVQGADAVIHLAGVLGTAELYGDADRAVDVNLKGTIRVLEACRDENARYVGITMPDCWANLYQATKVAAQRVATGFFRDYDVPVTHIRAFNAYGIGQAVGPGHPQKIIPTFATRSWRGEPMPIWGDGEQVVDLVHVDEIAWRLVMAAEGLYELTGHGEMWDAGTGRAIPVVEVAREVGRVTGCDAMTFLPMRRGETPGTDIRATSFGPWPPMITEDEELERLHETIRWYKT